MTLLLCPDVLSATRVIRRNHAASGSVVPSVESFRRTASSRRIASAASSAATRNNLSPRRWRRVEHSLALRSAKHERRECDRRCPGRVVVLSPHIDDETIGAGGVLMKHVSAGDRVAILTFADCTSERVAEGRAAAAVLGVHRLEFLPFQSRSLLNRSEPAEALDAFSRRSNQTSSTRPVSMIAIPIMWL